MKKVMSLFIVLSTFVVILTSCATAATTNGIKIETFEQELSSGEWNFSIKEKDDGFPFDYTDNSSVTNITYSGLADKNKNVKSISITNNDIDTDYLSNYSKFKKVFEKSSGQMTIADVRMLTCVLDLWHLKSTINPSLANSSESNDEIIYEAYSFFTR